MGRTSRSRRPCARGEVLCTETGRCHPCPERHAGPVHEGNSRTMSTYADEKSDEGILSMKQPNKEGAPSAEAVEGRPSPKGNGGRGPDTAPGYRVERTSRRAPSGATQQECAVHRTAASHHRRPPGAELLRSGARLGARHRRRDVAGLRRKPQRETDGSARSHTQRQLPRPPGPTHLHPEGGRISAASSSRRSRQFWKPIYEEDFVGLCYGFRPGRGQHDVLDALHVGIICCASVRLLFVCHAFSAAPQCA
jgi:RNA-directed DNA polymerase